jgi:hypothetical protein
MTRFTTEFVMIAPKVINGWGDEDWRVGFTAQLVEGGGGGPYWLIAAPVEATPEEKSPEVIVIGGLETRRVSESILLLLATTVGNSEVKSQLVERGLLGPGEGGPFVPHEWPSLGEHPTTGLEFVIENFRIGVVQLNEVSVLTDDVISTLEGWGLEVRLFSERPYPREG